MLKSCPECNLPVSDKAVICPHCGYPLKSTNKVRKATRSNKHRRLPNGFGQISEIKGQNLRNPYRAMVSVGKNSKGRPIVKPLKPRSFFKTYNEAYAALVEYNRNPYDLRNAGMSVKELYEKWSAYYFDTLKNPSSKRSIESAWRYCSSIYDMKVASLRVRHIKGVIEEGSANINGETRYPSDGTKHRIKSLFNMLLDYAVEYEIIPKNYSRDFSVSENENPNKDSKAHISFKDDELDTLWSNRDVSYVDAILIQCYMGWRPQELGLLKISNVNLNENYIIGGMKTEAGTNRKVPISPKIRPLVEKYMAEANALNSEYLINCTDTKTHRSNTLMTYDKYQKRFKKAINTLHLNPEHKAHDPRLTFVTMCKKNGVDEYAIKYMVGHQISDITEDVYTDREFSWLTEEIGKI